jgi:hypothetical protein
MPWRSSYIYIVRSFCFLWGLGRLCPMISLRISSKSSPAIPKLAEDHQKPQIINPTPPLHDTTQPVTMASLTHTSRTLLRALPRRANSAVLPIRALSISSKKSDTTSSFDSPFRGMGNDKASKIPDFGKYKSKSGTDTNLVFQYFMVGAMGALTAAGAKATVQGKF